MNGKRIMSYDNFKISAKTCNSLYTFFPEIICLFFHYSLRLKFAFCWTLREGGRTFLVRSRPLNSVHFFPNPNYLPKFNFRYKYLDNLDHLHIQGWCDSVVVKRSTINPGDQGSIPGLIGNFLRHLVFSTQLEVKPRGSLACIGTLHRAR